LNISRENRRISLGHKQVEPNPWDSFEAVFGKGVNTEGTIVRIVDKGAIVELPHAVEGFVPMSHLIGREGKRKKEDFKEGQMVKLQVIEFDKTQKKIVLSHEAFVKAEANENIEDFLAAESSRPTTVGDVLGAKGAALLQSAEAAERELIDNAQKVKEPEVSETPASPEVPMEAEAPEADAPAAEPEAGPAEEKTE
jgi:small subunit ribosomal protein S1